MLSVGIDVRKVPMTDINHGLVRPSKVQGILLGSVINRRWHGLFFTLQSPSQKCRQDRVHDDSWPE